MERTTFRKGYSYKPENFRMGVKQLELFNYIALQQDKVCKGSGATFLVQDFSNKKSFARLQHLEWHGLIRYDYMGKYIIVHLTSFGKEYLDKLETQKV